MIDGNIAFQGYTQECVSYFEKIGPSYTCPTWSNPADFYIKKLSINYPKDEDTKTRINLFNDSYNEHLRQSIEDTAS